VTTPATAPDTGIHAGSALEQAATELAEPFRPDELPGPLDVAGRLVLVRRLIREGYLLAL